MADKSAIEWTEATWNPVVGCSILSAGCAHCYAMPAAARHEAMCAAQGRISPYAGLTRVVNGHVVWTGEARALPFDHPTWSLPLRWKRPRLIFVNSMSDLAHEDVPDEAIDRVFATAALASQHTLQILTKRPERLRAHLSRPDIEGRIIDAALRLKALPEDWTWPLPNVWLGVSAERQQEADARIPELLATPAAVRWLSAEPLLGPIDLSRLDRTSHGVELFDALGAKRSFFGQAITDIARLDWVVAGGESGREARPMHPDWARGLRDQCAAAAVPFFFKQWGEWLPEGQFDRTGFQWAPGQDGKVHWWVQEPPYGSPLQAGDCSIRIGKKAAGRTLDGRTHDAMPEAARG